jgi:phosphocarrier protein HPr
VTSCEQVLKIVNHKGLHVRAATVLAKTASQFGSTITVEHAGEQANAKNIMNLLLLTAPVGSTIRVRVDGDDAEDALAAVVKVIQSGFGE